MSNSLSHRGGSSDDSELDPAAIELAIEDSLAALLNSPSSDSFWLKDYPTNSCDIASFVIGHVLLDRQLGDWTYLNGKAAERDISGSFGPAAHTWLELRRGNEGLYFIDAAVRQFRLFETAPLSGKGSSPAASVFSSKRIEDPVSCIPEWRTYPIYFKALGEVRSALMSKK